MLDVCTFQIFIYYYKMILTVVLLVNCLELSTFPETI